MVSKIFEIISGPIKTLIFLLVRQIPIDEARKSIHIVRLDAIGDFVLFSATLPYFKKIYPEYKIILIVDKVVEELAQWINRERILGDYGFDYFDELISIDGKAYNRDFFYYYTMLKKIRISSPEIVIQPTFSRTVKSDRVVLVSKEAKKIGYVGDFSNIKRHNQVQNDKDYDRLVVNPSTDLEVARNQHFVAQLSGGVILSPQAPRWEIAKALRKPMRNRLLFLGIDPAKPIVVICPGSSRKVKNWPTEKFVALLVSLLKSFPSTQYVLIGGNKEKDICAQIQQKVQSKNIYNASGYFSLPELAVFLAHAKLYIGNDTGSMHMASAVGASVIGIMSGEHGSRFFPYPAPFEGASNVAIFNKTNIEGVENVSIEDVLFIAQQVLGELIVF